MNNIILEMDGTLLDSKKDITISINHIRDLHYKLPPLSEDFIVEAINMDVRNLPKLFYNTEIYEKRDQKVFEVHYSAQCIKNPYLYDGMKETLEKLVESGVKISVATNAPTQFALKMLTHLGVSDMFDLIVGADKVSVSKPNPEMLNIILSHYGFNEANGKAWMVGDNSKDMQSADNAKIDSIFATWGFSPDGIHHTIINKPQEILHIVR